jgi:hypothetical protein
VELHNDIGIHLEPSSGHPGQRVFMMKTDLCNGKICSKPCHYFSLFNMDFLKLQVWPRY